VKGQVSKKTRVMSTGEQENIFVHSEKISTITGYEFSGALITNDGYTRDEIERRIALGKAAMAKLTKIMEDSTVSTNTKVKKVQTMVFPAVFYGCNSWTPKKADKRKIDAFNPLMPNLNPPTQWQPAEVFKFGFQFLMLTLRKEKKYLIHFSFKFKELKFCTVFMN
jgi:hypothetical protein